MNYVDINMLEEGMLIASDVYDTWGRKIVKRNTIVNAKIIKTLIRRDCKSVYVKNSIHKQGTKDVAKRTLSNAISLVDDKGQNGFYVNSLKAIEDDIEELISNLANEEIINFDLLNLHDHNKYTYKHCINVASISVVIGLGLGLPKSYLEDLYVAGILHDIGKVKISNDILDKNGSLTEDEYNIIKNHPTYGYSILFISGSFSKYIMSAVEEHHENWNGTGYPYGLLKNDINILARIIHVADVYDALTTNRPYRGKESRLKAYNFISAGKGTMFDPEVVNVFKERIIPLKIGCVVKLSNGCIGVVISNNTNNALKPTVRILPEGDIINLSKTSYSIIEEVKI